MGNLGKNVARFVTLTNGLANASFGPWIPVFVSCSTTMMALMWNQPLILEIKIVMPDFKRTILFLFRNSSENWLICNYVIGNFEINVVYFLYFLFHWCFYFIVRYFRIFYVIRVIYQ